MPTADEIKEIIAKEGDAVENQDLPNDAVVTRGTKRSTVFSVRLNKDEVEAVEAKAAALGIPASTLVRSWIVGHISGEAFDPADFNFRLRRIESRLIEDAKNGSGKPERKRKSA